MGRLATLSLKETEVHGIRAKTSSETMQRRHHKCGDPCLHHRRSLGQHSPPPPNTINIFIACLWQPETGLHNIVYAQDNPQHVVAIPYDNYIHRQGILSMDTALPML